VDPRIGVGVALEPLGIACLGGCGQLWLASSGSAACQGRWPSGYATTSRRSARFGISPQTHPKKACPQHLSSVAKQFEAMEYVAS